MALTGNVMPQGSTDLRQIYNPGRDVANALGGLLTMTIRTLDPTDAEHPVWFSQTAAQLNVSTEELGHAALQLTQALNSAVTNPNVPDLAQAIAASGFLTQRKEAQLLLLARFGQLCMALGADGIRQITYDGVTPPQALTVERALQQAQEFVKHFEPRG